MYILKNAWINIKRNKGRNLLIGIIIMVITISSCVALSINTSGNKLIESYKNQNQLEVSFSLDMGKLRDNNSEDETMGVERLTAENIENYGNSTYVSGYYYTYEASLSSENIEAVDMSEIFKKPENDNIDDKMPENNHGKMSQGDFRLTAYSDVTYADSFTSGKAKITSGSMITNDDESNSVVISRDLAENNDLEIGDTITLYWPENTDITYELKITGIFEAEDNSTDNFMNMTALSVQNQMYITTTMMNQILENADNPNNINAKFYLKNADDLEKFTAEVREKGLSEYYQVSDNTEEILATLKPIQNISNFSLTFLIVILVVGAIILAVINMINIRDRKYEIGVLRSIGMSKTKVIFQLILELFVIAFASFIIGTAAGYILSQPVTNKMLENEINSYQEENQQTRENFGGKNFKGPENFMTTTDYIDNLTVSLELGTVLKLFGVSMLLVIISGGVAVIFVTKYEPNKILQNRN